VLNIQILNPSRWYLHPVFIFACSIISLAAILVVTISWYMEITTALEVIILKFHIDPKLIFPSKTGMTILVLIALITVVMIGILLAFIYFQKTVDLFRLQHNFIYNFTHELKTPVTSLRIYLETFIKYELEPREIKKYSENMLEDINRLTDNINSILDLARIESQNFGSEITRESMIKLVKSFCAKNASLFRDLNIEIENRSNNAMVYPVNLFLFEMLLMNIISNAIKYNESQEPKLTIRFKNFIQKVTIEFIDNGIGVEKKEVKKIFRKFYQSDTYKANDVSGSGLGLYLVSSIAAIHGWRASATRKEKGEGAVFKITIPKASIANVREKNLWKQLKKSVSWS
jgi:two-component system, OmpR family, phosphate regulon sensor histidine kinase PhoR